MPVVFARLSEHLIKYNYKVSIIDYSDGAMTFILRHSKNISVLPFQDGIAFNTRGIDILVMQSILPHTIRKELIFDNNTKLFFWTLYAFNLVPPFAPISILRQFHIKSNIGYYLYQCIHIRTIRNLRDFLSGSIKKNGLVFMDYSTVNITKKYLRINSIPDQPILPIAIDIPHKKPIIEPRKIGSTNVFWVGRVEDFKTKILLYSIDQCRKYAKSNGRKLIFNIIGYGKDIDKIALRSDEYFKIEKLGKVELESLKDKIINNADIVFAMGTSALESAVLGVPTVLLDAGYRKVDNRYRFRWVYESDGASVGHFYNIEAKVRENRWSIEDIMSQLNDKPESIGKQCHNYVVANHDPKIVSAHLERFILKSSLKIADVEPYMKKGLIRQLYDNIRY